MRKLSKSITGKLRDLFDPDVLLSDLVFVVFSMAAGLAIDHGRGWAAGFWIALAIVHLGHTFKR